MSLIEPHPTPGRPQNPSASTAIEVFYPDRDGKPLGETGFHVAAIFALHQAFRVAFRKRRDIYVASDMFLYYEQGNPRAVKAPDVMVFQGVAPYERRTWKLWVEQAAPSVVFEVTSDETRREDATTKPEAYARIGIPEYFLFDPLGQYLRPPLRGHRLVDGRYERIEPDADGLLRSEQLGLGFCQEGPLVRTVDTGTGELIPTVDEMSDSRDESDQVIARLERRIAAERRRGDRNRKRAERATARAAADRAAAQAERVRVEALEAEIQRLRKLLGD